MGVIAADGAIRPQSSDLGQNKSLVIEVMYMAHSRPETFHKTIDMDLPPVYVRNCVS